MAQTPDAHLRLLIGDFAVQLAMIRAENDQLRDTNAALQAQMDAPKKTTKKPARQATT